MRCRFYIVLGGFFLSVSILALTIWLISADARTKIDELATANTDSARWSLAQGEVETMAMMSFIYRASLATPEDRPAELVKLRQRFDVLFARLTMMRTSEVFERVRADPEAAASLAKAYDFLDRAMVWIDGPDDRLVAALPRFLAAAEEMRAIMRKVSLSGVRVFAGKLDRQRVELADALSDLALIVLILFAALLAVVMALAILFRNSSRQAASTEATRNRLQAVIGTSIDAILVAGANGRILDFNEAACRMYGYSADEAIGAKLTDLVVPEGHRRKVQALLHRMRRNPRTRVRIDPLEATARRRSGEVFPVEVAISSAASHYGPVLVAFVRDISRRAGEQAELIRARDHAVAGERTKAKMLAVMSHEMRTPLNGVLGTMDLLKTTRLDARQRHYLEVMERSGRMLLSHVNDVLDISRVDSGNLQLASQPFCPSQVVSDVLDGLQAQAEQRGNLLSLSMIGTHQTMLLGDPGRLSQILVNLVGNAIKFTENGRITVQVDRSGASGEVEFRVMDTGIGIAAADLEKIFDEFVTLDSSYNRVVEGTGLGLGIVRRLASLMGGELRVESQPGLGSTFRVRLTLPEQAPALPADGAPDGPGQPGAAMLSQLDVLVVEDNATNRLIVREMLKQRHCRVVEACDGQEGVQMAQTRPFDLILMDISMPRMDGVSATRQIRQDGPNAATPIIALTAHALPEDLRHFEESGMTGVLTKPLSLERLEAAIAGIPSLRGAGPDAAEPVAETPHDHRAEDPQLSQARAMLADTLGPDRAEVILHRILAELHDGLVRLSEMAHQPSSFEDLWRLSHQLAGSAALVGFSRMHKAFAQLETDARAQTEGADAEDLQRQVAALRAMLPTMATRAPAAAR
ncbi:hybrid sensor histidine kinase/response regulator [Paracoccus sp. T5]|uniref:hybrid sensor histidine kinase/response regulator n=1 Tax=Paracoccus sp. T5 TaxID=3402161 RepID=UPI003AE22E4E